MLLLKRHRRRYAHNGRKASRKVLYRTPVRRSAPFASGYVQWTLGSRDKYTLGNTSNGLECPLKGHDGQVKYNPTCSPPILQESSRSGSPKRLTCLFS